MLTIIVPWSEIHPIVRITAAFAGGSSSWTLDDTHYGKSLDINLPAADEDIEILAEWCGTNGQPDLSMSKLIIKEKDEATNGQETNDGLQPADEPDDIEPAPKPVDESDAGEDEPSIPTVGDGGCVLGERTDDDAAKVETQE